ncbi:MAG: hypothetical protein HZA50_08965 [Planctomycetes bacterium]|nr:hypothetical protein [Planctomycetota bacterium]
MHHRKSAEKRRSGGFAGNAALESLQEALRAADASAVLAPPLLLCRVIKQHRRIQGIGLQMPHRSCYVMNRKDLLEIVDADELGLRDERDLPDRIILVARPDQDEIAGTPPPLMLLKLWRVLFHARVHLVMEMLHAEGKLTSAMIRRRIHQIGQTEFDEIRAVLRHDNQLLPPRDNLTAYTEFAAVYLELRHFAPHLLPRYFPTIWSLDHVDMILAEDIESSKLFAQTRPEGAAEPLDMLEAVHPAGEDAGAAEKPGRMLFRDDPERLMARCQGAIRTGNTVRAAIFMMRAANVAQGEEYAGMRDQARSLLGHLARRLAVMLELDQNSQEQWRLALESLLNRAAGGYWPVEARFLYDLQKACVENERQRYSVNLVEWAMGLGRKPLKKPLPVQREVQIVRHIRSAAARLAKIMPRNKSQKSLPLLVRSAERFRQDRLRADLHRVVSKAMDEVGMAPANVPEKVAYNKIVEELLDRIMERGLLTMQDLRDTISRNSLKLPDIVGKGDFLWQSWWVGLLEFFKWTGKGFYDFFRGDMLLRLDHKLAAALDGAYRGGEIYMRWLQRLSSLTFGTILGRWLTLYLLLPFGGAFLMLEAVKAVIHLFISSTADFTSWSNLATLGLALLCLLHIPVFREAMFWYLKGLFRAIRFILIGLPVRILGTRFVQSIIQSRIFMLAIRYMVNPLILAGVVWLCMWLCRADSNVTMSISAGFFLAASILFNTKPGRRIQEAAADWMARTWRVIRVNILYGLIVWTLEIFKMILEAFDRLLYSVDEWLRFKGAEGLAMRIIKPILGVVWFYVSYIIRLLVNVFIEPQINPIKHFPVVTVSHKLLVGVWQPLAEYLVVTWGMERAAAYALTFNVLTSIPGMFGFLVWEFKANWRLYAANRPRNLRPVPIGHHGETMIRLMKPGFHSGTLPKLYAKIRRAELNAKGHDYQTVAGRQRQALSHVKEAVARFVERDLIELLRLSGGWDSLELSVGEIRVGSNRIGIELRCPQLPHSSLWLAFEEQSGWLVACVARTGWLDKLEERKKALLQTALAGLYRMAGVDLIREQIQACFDPRDISYDISDRGLVVWPDIGTARPGGDDAADAEAVYDLRKGAIIRPHFLGGRADLPDIDAATLLYPDRPARWENWVRSWDKDKIAGGDFSFAGPIRVLPAPLKHSRPQEQAFKI